MRVCSSSRVARNEEEEKGEEQEEEEEGEEMQTRAGKDQKETSSRVVGQPHQNINIKSMWGTCVFFFPTCSTLTDQQTRPHRTFLDAPHRQNIEGHDVARTVWRDAWPYAVERTASTGD